MKPALLTPRLIPLASLVPLTLLLAACDSKAPDQPVATASPSGTPDVAAPAPTTTSPAPPVEASPAATEIPATMQGRWGLVSADCEAGRADAKGLVTIGPKRLAFYESVGTLDTIEEQADNRIRGRFSFTGEGMAWSRTIALELQDGGNTLVRTDNSPEAGSGPLRYGKCR